MVNRRIPHWDIPTGQPTKRPFSGDVDEYDEGPARKKSKQDQRARPNSTARPTPSALPDARTVRGGRAQSEADPMSSVQQYLSNEKGTEQLHGNVQQEVDNCNRIIQDAKKSGPYATMMSKVVDGLQTALHGMTAGASIRLESRRAKERRRRLEAKGIHVPTMNLIGEASNSKASNILFRSGDWIQMPIVVRMRDQSKVCTDNDYISSPAGVIYEGWYTVLILFRRGDEYVVLIMCSNGERGFKSLSKDEWARYIQVIPAGSKMERDSRSSAVLEADGLEEREGSMLDTWPYHARIDEYMIPNYLRLPKKDALKLYRKLTPRFDEVHLENGPNGAKMGHRKLNGILIASGLTPDQARQFELSVCPPISEAQLAATATLAESLASEENAVEVAEDIEHESEVTFQPGYNAFRDLTSSILSKTGTASELGDGVSYAQTASTAGFKGAPQHLSYPAIYSTATSTVGVEATVTGARKEE